MTNAEKKRLKDIIINTPHTFIRYREKLVYVKQIASKSGELFEKFTNRDFGVSYYIKIANDMVFIPHQGKLIPHLEFRDIVDRISENLEPIG